MWKRQLAVVTMVHNEPDMLPIWLRHYGREVGPRNCYVLDHGSTDQSTRDVGEANLIRLPPSPFDDNLRAQLVSDFCASLLPFFDSVAYTDCDEMLVADPSRHEDLIAFSRATADDVVTCFGMDLLQIESEEGPLDLNRPILSQRHWVRPSAGSCKPLLFRRRLYWCMGFHFADASTHLGDLLMFHLAYCDFGMIARRQAKRMATAKVAGTTGGHHDWKADMMVEHVRTDYTMLPREAYADLSPQSPLRQDFTRRLFERGDTRAGRPLLNHGVSCDAIWRVPERFQDRL